MRILIIGSGGREHALAWKLKQSPEADEIFVAPGNGGTASLARNLPISEGDVPALVAFAREHQNVRRPVQKPLRVDFRARRAPDYVVEFVDYVENVVAHFAFFFAP